METVKSGNSSENSLIPVSLRELDSYGDILTPLEIQIHPYENIFDFISEGDGIFIMYIDRLGIPCFLEYINYQKIQLYRVNVENEVFEYLLNKFAPYKDETYKLN